MYRSTGAYVSLAVCAISLSIGPVTARKATDCECGYYDPSAETLWTESIIVYFNESMELPIPNFVEESFSHQYEKGWTTQFRTGADASNIGLSNSSSAAKSVTSLELEVSPYNSDHLVVGSSLRTSRQDIQYGSFTSLLRSPGKAAGGGGSVLSFAVEYNSSQSVSTNLQNTDLPSTASVTMLANEEEPSTSFIQYDNMTDGKFGNGKLSPWNYTEYRLEWTKDEVRYFIGGNLARSISRSAKPGLLSVPSPLYFRHWSNGLATGSQGPPDQPSIANIGWARLFFNSSLMSDSDHINFDARCSRSTACHALDTSLRGSSTGSEDSTKSWKQAPQGRARRAIAIWLAVACISLTASVLLGPIWTRVKERLSSPQTTRRESIPLSQSRTKRPERLPLEKTPIFETDESSTGTSSLFDSSPSSSSFSQYSPSESTVTIPKHEGNQTFRRRSTLPVDPLSHQDELNDQDPLDAGSMSSKVPPANPPIRVLPLDTWSFTSSTSKEQAVKDSQPDLTHETPKAKKMRVSWHNREKAGGSVDPISSAATTPAASASGLLEKNSETHSKPKEAFPSVPEPQKRIDHLAGLVVISCLLMTAINFNFTFLYGDILEENFTRFHSLTVARKTITPFFLNQIWMGPFFLTSARFLTANYLRTGDLLIISEKTVARTFRLMLPVTAVVMLEYFFIEISATKWLEYLPSITWSTWPFIRGYSNFSNFLSEVLELGFVIPNTLPVITFNYCTNVLWTIPVQLQGSWTTLLAVIVIREIKTPWKRFCFYVFCIVNHWYALSWASYFYFGIMLADLDITYKWQAYLHARPFMYYPFIVLCICLTFAGPSLDLLSQRAEIDYAAREYGIHPNLSSGLTISEASSAVNLEFYIPKLNGLAFAIGLQTAIELSPFIQKIFSFKLLLLVFPHIFTIYLLHGFIFWSLGSWICVFLAVRSLSYWSNVLIVALCCYITLGLSVPIVTPVVKSLGKTVTADIWRQARDEPAPRRPTLYPFPKDLFLNRYEISYERRPSEWVSVVTDEHKRAGSVKPITRDRKPSKDIRTWQDPGPSGLRTSWHERQQSITPRTPVPDRRPSTDPRAPGWNRRPSVDPRSPGSNRRPSTDPRAPGWDRRPSVDPRSPASNRRPSTDPRVPGWDRRPSTDPRNRESRVFRPTPLDVVEDEEEE